MSQQIKSLTNAQIMDIINPLTNQTLIFFLIGYQCTYCTFIGSRLGRCWPVLNPLYFYFNIPPLTGFKKKRKAQTDREYNHRRCSSKSVQGACKTLTGNSSLLMELELLHSVGELVIMYLLSRTSLEQECASFRETLQLNPC